MKNIKNYLFAAAAVIGLTMQMTGPVRAESDTAQAMRLLHYEGDVEILDPDGKPRLFMENARFDSGETMRTMETGSASVEMDEDKIVTLDEKTTVEFVKKSKAMQLNLKEGRLLLDVREKLDENETLDIQTAAMMVEIRGTIVFASTIREAGVGGTGASRIGESAAADSIAGTADAPVTQLGVLEGTAQITYREADGIKRKISIEAGQKITLRDPDEDGTVEEAPVIESVSDPDLEGFLNTQLAGDATLKNRVETAKGEWKEAKIPVTEEYPANGDWTWQSAVTLVAQSASKLYDGQPLTCPADVLVYGLPPQFSIQAKTSGSQTDAGKGTSQISSYTIYNMSGEDVTGHFDNIQTVQGNLIVDPAPLCVRTGSAQKVYDGTVLTSEDISIRSVSGYQEEQTPWRNSSYVITPNEGTVSDGAGQTLNDNEILYGVCGTVRVHGTDPLTGKVSEIQLLAGQRMTAYLHDDEKGQCVEFGIETISEEEIPEEILRFYSDNPDLLAQACLDTGWDPALIAKRIAGLSPLSQEEEDGAGGTGVTANAVDHLMTDNANVRIHIDTSITNYNDRSLRRDEARFTPVQMDPKLRITATGNQTQVGESINTYTIDWGTVNPGNYILSEELGTLRVTPANATVSTGSASKVYDGTPLTDPEASITGLVNGESAAVTATGSQTQAGSSINSYTINWKTADSQNYSVTENLGTLTVEAAGEQENEDPEQDAKVTFTAASSKKVYDGTALTNAKVSADGLPDGYTFFAEASGSQTDAGSSENKVSTYQILDADGRDVTEHFSNITIVNGKLTVTPAQAVVTTKSATKEYDGTALDGWSSSMDTVNAASHTRVTSGTDTEASESGTEENAQTASSGTQSSEQALVPNDSASISGLTDEDAKEVTIVATGTITKIGTIENSYRISWGKAKAANYSITEKLGTLEVTNNTSQVIIMAGSADKVYDGCALTEKNVEVQGLPPAFTSDVEISGSQTDAGNSDNTISSYRILDADGEDVTEAFTNITAVKGTLIVRPAPASVTTGSASKEYDGTPLTGAANASAAAASITGLAEADAKAVTVTATGTITNVGTAENTYEISWGSAKATNYTLTEKTGMLEVTKNTAAITISAGSASKVFDGIVLTEGTVNAQGVPSALIIEAQTAGSITDAGSIENTISSCRILDANGEDVTEFFSDIHTENGTLSVDPLQLNVDLGGDTFVYDGTLHCASPAGNYENGEHAGKGLLIRESKPCDGEMTGEVLFELFTGDTLSLTYFGYGYDAGSSEIRAEHMFAEGKESNYIVSFTNNTFTVLPATLTVTTGSAEKVYDGTPLTNDEADVTGLVPSDTGWDDYGVKVTATGSQTEVGESKNIYSIDWGVITPSNYDLTENLGTLKVTDEGTISPGAGKVLSSPPETDDPANEANASNTEISSPAEEEAEEKETSASQTAEENTADPAAGDAPENTADPAAGEAAENTAEPAVGEAPEKEAEPAAEAAGQKAADPTSEPEKEEAARQAAEAVEEKPEEKADEPATEAETEKPAGQALEAVEEKPEEKADEPVTEAETEKPAGQAAEAVEEKTEDKADEPATEAETEKPAGPSAEAETENAARPSAEAETEKPTRPAAEVAAEKKAEPVTEAAEEEASEPAAEAAEE